MAAWFIGLHPIAQALMATLFTWGLTALGAGLVFFFKTNNQKILDGMLGFVAGVVMVETLIMPPWVQFSDLLL